MTRVQLKRKELPTKDGSSLKKILVPLKRMLEGVKEVARFHYPSCPHCASFMLFCCDIASGGSHFIKIKPEKA
jgi:hypothetical protein